MGRLVVLFVASALVTSCSKIDYQAEVIPTFKQKHPSAEVTYILPIGRYSLGTFLGQKTDLAIDYNENGELRQEIWTAVQNSGWSVTFKCKSVATKCVD